MSITQRVTVKTSVLGLGMLLLTAICVVGAEQPQTQEKSSEQLLLDILDLHSSLVTSDVFLAQAKMMGAYLESAQSMEESKKVVIYRRVLSMLERIKDSRPGSPAASAQAKGEPEKKMQAEQQSDNVVYTPGVALLEIFKTDSMNNLPAIPITRAYWKNDMACAGGYLLPGQINEIGAGSPYVARFLFYYEAKQSGLYGFTIAHDSTNDFKLTVGDDVIASSGTASRGTGSFGAGFADANRTRPIPAACSTQHGLPVVRAQLIGRYPQPAYGGGGGGRNVIVQGTANLEKGFHRVEFWLISRASPYGNAAGFEVKIQCPGDFNAGRLTKNMMLLKADQLKTPQGGQPKGTSGQAVPYVDY